MAGVLDSVVAPVTGEDRLGCTEPTAGASPPFTWKGACAHDASQMNPGMEDRAVEADVACCVVVMEKFV